MDAMNLWAVIRDAPLYGGVLSVALSVLLLGVLWINPEILLNDYPPDIREKHGPMSERSKRQRVPAAILLGLSAGVSLRHRFRPYAKAAVAKFRF